MFRTFVPGATRGGAGRVRPAGAVRLTPRRWERDFTPVRAAVAAAEQRQLSNSADAVAAALPRAQRQTIPGQQHNVEPAAIAPAVVEFFKR